MPLLRLAFFRPVDWRIIVGDWCVRIGSHWLQIIVLYYDQPMLPLNVRIHRAPANSLNIEIRATRGSLCNPLSSIDSGLAICCSDSYRREPI